MRRSFRWGLAKWFGMLLELYFLFVFVNAAFLVPYAYDWERALLVAASALIAGACAYCSSLGTVKLSAKKVGTQSKAVFAGPFLLWELVTAVTFVILGVYAFRNMS